MDQKYSDRETLLADCLNCRQPYLVLLKYALDKKGGPTSMQKLQDSNICSGIKEKIVYCLMREEDLCQG